MEHDLNTLGMSELGDRAHSAEPLASVTGALGMVNYLLHTVSCACCLVYTIFRKWHFYAFCNVCNIFKRLIIFSVIRQLLVRRVKEIAAGIIGSAILIEFLSCCDFSLHLWKMLKEHSWNPNPILTDRGAGRTLPRMPTRFCCVFCWFKARCLACYRAALNSFTWRFVKYQRICWYSLVSTDAV
jgi:hypothetical protein